MNVKTISVSDSVMVASVATCCLDYISLTNCAFEFTLLD